MEPLSYLTLVGQNLDNALSALPEAPVVDWSPRPQRISHVRGALANSLHRLGDAVAPAAGNSAPGRTEPAAA